MNWFLIGILIMLSSCMLDTPPSTNNIKARPKKEESEHVLLDPKLGICTYTYTDKDKLSGPKLIDQNIDKHSPPSYVKELLKKYNSLWIKNFDYYILGSQIKIFKAQPIDKALLLSHEFKLSDKLSISILAKPYNYQTGEAFVDFANKFIGGGVLEGGFVQEEIMLSESNFLPWVAENRLENKENKGLSFCKDFSLTNLDTDPRVIYLGIIWHWAGVYGVIADPEKNLVLDAPRKDIYAIAMAAKSFDKGSKYNKQDIEQMVLTATKAFYEAMLALDQDNKPLKITTGNWGAGVFNNSLAMAYGMQRLAVQAAYDLFKIATNKNLPMNFEYDTFGPKEEKVIRTAQEIYDKKLAKVNNLAQGIEVLYALSQEDSTWQVKK
jgi:hypothetical protein